MKLLALETSMGKCSVAVASTDRGVTIRREAEMARGHAEALMPMVEAAMAESAIAYSDLDRIAATTGPGSFTGVRIAIAAARGLALATGAELWGTDSLSVMARRAVQDGLNGGVAFAVAVDARRDSLYFGGFDADGTPRGAPALLHVDEAVASLTTDISIVLGSGGEALAAASGRDLAVAAPDLQPDASALAELALGAMNPTPGLRPLYLRPPDAKPQSGKAVERL
ncbi:tRNA threonylcarbamoyladenosine biosynthesis protein TsaB [Methyloligella halotolerans]|uniref:tRNA threonylcarbamoyladenosine biosynthesis protein TsaB n=1 Tax=Methyloligella halotolerans TaxID=1177755 RepID=A0A1E2S0M6_9HYPH|nr:tRNA (adenosine(37)-N6)-threonylcarbamoyltransferase complex dimerization subunit type 1 TsaB [Methyloligella halotolerans]ODA67875.1 tRNA threonylcarbamoyladenosine biosynthesis protein TsaB [Methyloligella halotolerans]